MAPTMRFLAVLAILPALIHGSQQRFGAVPQPAMTDALTPRFLIDRTFPLVKRVGGCDDDYHPCDETGNPGECCANDSYCYVTKEGDSRCCPIGANCSNNSFCSSDAWYCTTTTSSKTKGTTTTYTTSACCPRKCSSTSQYYCGEGKGCCGYNAECRADGCVETAKPTSTEGNTSGLKPVVEGCTTSQYKCPDGKGCCDDDKSCTQVSGSGVCAPGRPTETGLEYIDDKSGGDELSDGAKAGIGVGSVVGAAIIIGGLTWWWIYKRRRGRTATQPSGSGDGRPEDQAVTEVSQSSRPVQRGRGLTQDYFGPDQVAGPFTEPTDHGSIAGGASAASPGLSRAVPSNPQAPGDIAAPVELGSEVMSEHDRASPTSPTSLHLTPAQPETIDGRFELAGSHEEPPPRSPSITDTPAAFIAERSLHRNEEGG